jgi:hypothetical protein
MMADSRVELEKVLKEDFYCRCGTWVYSPQMNKKVRDEQGNERDEIGDGCLLSDGTGDYLECPGCKGKYYLA